jgi:hypothetical protein
VAVWSRLTGAIAGIGIGGAAAAAAEPVFEVPKQKAWQSEPNKVLSIGDLAGLVATGLLDLESAVAEGARTGYAASRVRARVQLALRVPGIGELDRMLNRGTISREQFNHALGKHGIEAQYWDGIYDLLSEKLSPGELAAAIHRGLVPDPGLLQGEQPEPPFTVEHYPVYPIDAVAEAQAHGFDKERLGVLVGLQGLPMGPHEAAQAVFRGLITWGDYITAFNTSSNRNEWARAIYEQSKQIPTARDYLENALRGYRSLAEAVKGAARHGMNADDATMIYQNQGRPMNIRQITQALSRGAEFHPEPGELTDPYEAATVEGSVKPAYYEMFKALKYTLPSPFVMRQLTSSGVWSEEKCAKRLKDIGWIPGDADEAAHAWATGSSADVDPWVSKARTQLWTTTHRSYVAGETEAAEARDYLTVLGLDQAARDAVIEMWTIERDATRKQLTPAQVKKAYAKAVPNIVTNQPWTREDALDALLRRGYSLADAESFLAQ